MNKKKYNPAFIAACKQTIERAMNDHTTTVTMADVMSAAATTFGYYSSDEEVYKLSSFLIELDLLAIQRINEIS